ncbi:MAG: hypothetical protein H6791_01465 [Candidatus Nomurabacteria bacterium]|nr:MAG: hypothetical protein H6791_01465 [Candidatus Nomurabacteria bacterium]
MKKILPISIALTPFLAFAQTGGTDAGDIFNTIAEIVGAIIPFLITIAIIVFIWGVIQFVIAKDDGTKEKGRNVMISGIIGLFVILAVFGLIRVISNTFEIDQGGTIIEGDIPGVEIPTL